MKMRIKRTAYVLSALLLSLFCFFGSFFPIKAIAEKTTYSDVLSDLQEDENFNAEEYLEDSTDYTLYVIQLAESSSGELFVYVYQPSHNTIDLTATKITISQNLSDRIMYEVFNLKLVSTSGVFDKYVVLGLEIKDIVIRAYRITEIFRAFNADIDEEATGDNTITQIACPVGQEWYALTENGKVRYIVNETEYITITSKHVGFIRYLDGGLWVWSKDMTDSHYVAFSTDKQMDNLYEAELVYSYDKYTRFCSTNPFDSADRLTLQATAENVHKTLNKYEDSVNVDNILFNDDYSYNRIQRVEEFKAKESEKFTEGTEESLDGKQWVLRFFESDYSYMYNYVSSDVPGLAYSMETTSWTTVRDVGLLRLTYEYGGKVYDMGVVDNLTQGDEVPDNENPYEPEYPDWLGKIKDLIITCILIFGACIILSVIPGIGAIFGLVFSVILKGVGLGFKGLFWFIGLPFRLIGKLFKRKKRDK